MAALAAEHEGLRVTFNVVPSLIDQLEDVAEGRTADPALMFARRDADTLNEEERLAILDLFFSVPYRTLIAPFPRYTNLYHKRGARGSDGSYREAARRFKPHDYRDLLVWFHLAWSGERLKGAGIVRELIRKGEGFTEDDKSALLEAQQTYLQGILPHLRSLARGSAIELSTSPYYHPILPLLCDSDSALQAVPSLVVPRPPFQRPADAADQIRSAMARHERAFGSRPRGMWPSEGSLSEEAVRLIGTEGISWAASDEGILAAALERSGEDGGWGGRPGPERTCFAWNLAGEPPALFFRDRELSDLVGFTYSSWRSGDAAADFVARLLRTREALGDRAGEAVVPVILDGENAWEHYPDNGVEFLSELYRTLTGTEGIATTTFSGYLDASPPPRRLERLRAGSWIRSDFTTWIGHQEKNRGWDLLRDTRAAFDRLSREVEEESRRTAWVCLQAAEGSDWFWWYGEEHSSEEDSIFDASFRALLSEAWRLLGETPPAALSQPIMGRRRDGFERPTGQVKATLDGRKSDYFEWLLAGICESASGLGTMSPGVAPVERIAFGWSPGHLYLRVDPLGASALELLRAGELRVVANGPGKKEIVIRCAPGELPSADPSEVNCVADIVAEIDIPLHVIGAKDGDSLAFSVLYHSPAIPGERFPRDGDIVFDASPSYDWSV
jgi:alpha-amylase/alpha-mannosidase (GH57 family)